LPLDPNHERRALLFLIGVVEELSLRQTQDPEWAKRIALIFDKHRRELQGEVVAWPQSE
jgi:hypothetical protein